MHAIDGSTRAVVVGLGKSGYSAARFLRARGAAVGVTDSRAAPPMWAALQAEPDGITARLGGFDASLLAGANLLVVSPGVATGGAFFAAARRAGLAPVGDIELFARAARAPVAGVTGTNGKSTVTTLLGRMAARCGRRVRVGGNLGEPALDLLDDAAELYVLELSSYQLELTESLRLRVAVLLNISPDHLDRYASVADYAASKARIFRHCDAAVLNADDERVMQLAPGGGRRSCFSLRPEAAADFRLVRRQDGEWLSASGTPVLAAAELKIQGRHNLANALASLAAGVALDLPMAAMLQELREFPGLAHRAQWVAEHAGVRYIDDSKGTNVGATIAAVQGLSGPLVLIAGGEGKGQDFTPLRAAFAGKVRHCLLIGRDAPQLEAALAGVCVIERCVTLESAVARAAAVAQRGDSVLLSPACASLDMFRDYVERGERFAAAARGLGA